MVPQYDIEVLATFGAGCSKINNGEDDADVADETNESLNTDEVFENLKKPT